MSFKYILKLFNTNELFYLTSRNDERAYYTALKLLNEKGLKNEMAILIKKEKKDNSFVNQWLINKGGN